MMANFTRQRMAFPHNVCAMTTITSGKTVSRVDELRAVDAQFRALSIEPLWEDIADQLDLTDIDWVIVGGESAKARDLAAPFELDWARRLRDRCADTGTAFFMKQLGSNAFDSGKSFLTEKGHGSDWSEWPKDLQIREFPQGFHSYSPDQVKIGQMITA